MLRLLTAPVPSPHHHHHQRHQRHQHHHIAAASRFLNNVSFPTPATTTTTFLVSNLFVFSPRFVLSTQSYHLGFTVQRIGVPDDQGSLWVKATATHRTTHFPLTWHFSLHSELSSSHASWHKLEIDNRNLFNICQLQNTLLFHSGLANNNFSYSKGSGLRAGNEGFPHVGKEWRYVANPIIHYVFLYLL